ncbi:MAG: PAS domain-containing protein [Alphaproteobacteria bacterium]|nr:PAS domain-containing protein [Alphaproteobacteria bacterium]
MTGEETFHPDTRALLVYGRALAGGREAPKKGGADQVLERLFVIQRMKDGRWPLRSFGSELIALFGQDLRERDFATLFLEQDWKLIVALIESCAAAGGPGIARVHAETEAAEIGAEILFTPLKIDEHIGERYLGMFQPLGGEAFLDGRRVQRLKLGSLHPPFAKPKSPVRLIVNNA